MPVGRLLTPFNHDRDAVGMRYVYPVVSRRAGGVSIGINLNPNNACNWACIYCQVPDLVRGGPPPLDLKLLESELEQFLQSVLQGDFMVNNVPESARRLVDVAFSGNGEPTSAPEFPEAVACVLAVLAKYQLLNVLPIRLITNGSLIARRSVRDGLARLAPHGGEVWFKIDAVSPEHVAEINRVSQTPGAVIKRLQQCASAIPTWVQTCFFMLDGLPPEENELIAYLETLSVVRESIRGVLLYGVARPSMQPAAPRLTTLAADWWQTFVPRVEALGLTVTVSP